MLIDGEGVCRKAPLFLFHNCMSHELGRYSSEACAQVGFFIGTSFAIYWVESPPKR